MNSDYKLILKRSAIKFLATQESSVKERIAAGLDGLLKIPQDGDIKKMKGQSGYYRLRIGTYRAIFQIDHYEKVIYVEVIGSRGDVYKN